MALLKYRNPDTDTWEPAGKGPTGFTGPQGYPGDDGPPGTGMTQTTMDTLYLPTTGGTMTGPLDMGGQRITNLAPGVTGDDLITVSQLPTGFDPPSQVQPEQPAPRGTHDTWIDTDTSILTEDDTWIPATLTGGWTNYGGSFPTAAYRKLRGGTIQLKGLVKGGDGGVANPIFTLPFEYRPGAGKMSFLVEVAAYKCARIDVTHDTGIVYVIAYLDGGTNDWVSLSGIRFTTG